MQVWIYSLLSVVIVSLLSLLGILTLGIKEKILNKILIYFVSFSAGALFGDVFIHLLPEIIEKTGLTVQLSSFVLLGIVVSLFIEKVIHWRHCHMPVNKNHIHSFAYMNLFGDSVHNFIDGLIIGAAYLISIPVGIATSLAVIFHEIPQEIGDFGILIYAGIDRKKALIYNFLTATTAILGTIIAILLSSKIEGAANMLSAFASGSFIYIAGSDLIPELHKETELKKSFIQIFTFILGIAIMYGLLVVG